MIESRDAAALGLPFRSIGAFDRFADDEDGQPDEEEGDDVLVGVGLAFAASAGLGPGERRKRQPDAECDGG